MWGRESVPENVNEGDHDPEPVNASGFVNGEHARIGALVNERIEHVGGDSCHVVGLDLDCGHGDDHDPCPVIAIDHAFCPCQHYDLGPALGLEIGCGCDGLVYSFGHQLDHHGNHDNHDEHPYRGLGISQNHESDLCDGLYRSGMCVVVVSDCGSDPVPNTVSGRLGPQLSHASSESRAMD